MTKVKTSYPGHWGDRPFVMPTQAEIDAADEIHDMARANRYLPLLALALPFSIALVVWLVLTALKT